MEGFQGLGCSGFRRFWGNAIYIYSLDTVNSNEGHCSGAMTAFLSLGLRSDGLDFRASGN